MPVTSPFCETDATVGFEEDHLRLCIDALAGKTALVTCNVSTAYIVALRGTTLILVTNVFENAVYNAFASRVPLMEPRPVVLSYPGVLL